MTRRHVAKRRPTGRPTTLTADVERKIIRNIRGGGTPRASAVAVGVPAATFDEWMQRGFGTEPTGRPQTERYAQFAQKVAEAVAEKRVKVERQVSTAQPLAWLRATARDVWTESLHVQTDTITRVVVEYVDAGADGPPPRAAPALGATNGDGQRTPV